MIKEELLIHIGYHKTGTTWLQNYFFRNPDTGFMMPFEREKVFENIVFVHPFDFDAELCCSYFNSVLKKHGSFSLYPVLSVERLSGLPHCGDYESRDIANHLVSIFERPKILIVIREQVNMILSIYSQYIKIGGTLSLEQYMSLKRKHLTGQKGPDISRYRYHRLIAYYQELFGKENVLVLPYEQFKHKPQDYVQKITDFCKVPKLNKTLPFSTRSNPSKPWLAIKLASKLNAFICSPNLPFNPTPYFYPK